MHILAFIICAVISLCVAWMYYHSKNKTVDQICKHPELSDAKIEAISRMMTKQHKEFRGKNNKK